MEFSSIPPVAEFAQFMEENPTIFHFTEGITRMLDNAGFTQISERKPSKLSRGGKYYVVRDLSAIVAFEIGENFVPGDDGFAMVAGHIDANRLRIKPTSIVDTKQGYLRLGAAVYGGPALASWWDRDLGLGGRVVLRSGTNQCITTRNVRIPGIIGSIPSLAPHFGPISNIVSANLETNFVPLLSTGLNEADLNATEEELSAPLFDKHPLPVLRVIAQEANCKVKDLLELELEFFSAERPAIGGLNEDLLYCGRLDDKLCSYTAIKGLIESSKSKTSNDSKHESDHAVKLVALYDNEEIGSETRTGGRNKLMEWVMDLVSDSFYASKDDKFRTNANSICISADVTHAVNPNYMNAYCEGHMPKLNTGMTIKRLGRFTSTGFDSVLCQLVSDDAGQPLQSFAPRNDTASGSTIGPMRAASTGIRTIDVGIPVLAMHSIREITGTKDISLGISWFRSFFNLANNLTQMYDL